MDVYLGLSEENFNTTIELKIARFVIELGEFKKQSGLNVSVLHQRLNEKIFDVNFCSQNCIKMS